MKNVLFLKIIVCVLCASFSLSVIAMQQKLDVCIRFKKSVAIPADRVDNSIKKKCETFGMLKHSTPSDTFFRVVSAVSEDCLDTIGCAQFKKDLIDNIPYMIQRDLLKKFDQKKPADQEQINIVANRYSFPTLVPQSFIEHVEQHPNIVHELYSNCENSLTVRYAVQELKEKLYKTPSSALAKETTSSNYRIASFFDLYGVSELGLYTFFLLLLSR